MPRQLHFRGLLIAWTGIVICSLAWNVYTIGANTRQVVTQVGRSFFQEILVTRAWNANHGGVYVPITTETQPNPYLTVLNRDVTTTEGIKLTKINPAYMTRQIAELSREKTQIVYHITSANPIRPENRADAWETQALQHLDAGAAEHFAFVKAESAYRYMAPLAVDATCLPCHAPQGYRVGDVRGGISVTIPAQPYQQTVQSLQQAVSLIHVLFWGIGLGGLQMFRKSREQQLTLLDQKNRALEHEIEERKGVEHALFQAKTDAETAYRVKSEFLANVSHEIRTPMNAIVGFADILLEKINHPQYHQYLAAISASSRALLGLLSDILDVSRSNAHTLELRPEPVYLAHVLQEIKQLFLAELEAKQIQFRLDIAPALPQAVFLDRIRTRQILISLVGNSVKFTAHGYVALRVQSETPPAAAGQKANLTFEIEDTGIGIPPAEQASLFDPFQHQDQAKRRKYGGLGLGLAMVKRLIDLMRGTITVTSQEGQGTRVRVCLPDIDIFEAGEQPPKPFDDESLPEVSRVPFDLPDEVKARLPQLLVQLDATFLPQWRELRELLIMQEVMAFAQRLYDLAECYAVSELIAYSQQLLEATRGYNVVVVERLLEAFPNICNQLKCEQL